MIKRDTLNERNKPSRVLLAKVGLDGHDRGVLVVARGLVDAGVEVIYTGRCQKIEQVVSAAIQEDVNLIGLSFLSGAHNFLVSKMMDELKKRGAESIPVIVGGFIPPEDVSFILSKGVRKVFGPGSKMEDIVNHVKQLAAENVQSDMRA